MPKKKHADDAQADTLGGPALYPAGQRLAAVLDLLRSRKNAASVAGVSVEQLARYVKGASGLPFVVASRLCAATGVSLDWLATGEGAMLLKDRAFKASALDEELLADVVQAVEELLEERGLAIKPERKAQLVAALYDLTAAETGDGAVPHVDKKTVARLLRLVA